VTRIRILFLLNGVAVAVVLPFASVILADRGFSPAAIGLVIALVSVGTVVSVSAWGHLGDVVLGRARAMQVSILAAAGFLLLFALPLPPILVGCAYIAYGACYGAVGPLSDALAVNAMRDPAREYGRVLALTSASFTVASIALGLIYGALGYGPAAVLFAAVAVATAAAGSRVPDLGRAALTAGRRGGAIREALAIQPALPRILLAIGLVYGGMFAGFTFLPLRIVELGGGRRRWRSRPPCRLRSRSARWYWPAAWCPGSGCARCSGRRRCCTRWRWRCGASCRRPRPSSCRAWSRAPGTPACGSRA
jgi:MFS family permease